MICYFTGNHDVSFDQRKDDKYQNAYYLKQKHRIVLEGKWIALNNKEVLYFHNKILFCR